MNPPPELLAAITQWGEKTLADFRADAEKEFNGLTYQKLKRGDDVAIFLALCITGEYELGKVADLFPDAGHANGDWSKITMAQITLAALRNEGFLHEPLRNPDRTLAALVLIVAEPELIEKVSPLLGIP